jgi:hypothetical protein
LADRYHVSKKLAVSISRTDNINLLYRDYLCPEDGGSRFLRNVIFPKAAILKHTFFLIQVPAKKMNTCLN